MFLFVQAESFKWRCPGGWEQAEDYTCLLVVYSPVTHRQAHKACKRQGAYLAVLNSPKVNKRAEKILAKQSSEFDKCQIVEIKIDQVQEGERHK